MFVGILPCSGRMRLPAVLFAALLVVALPVHAARKIELKPEYLKKFNQAAQAYEAQDYDKALSLIAEAEKIQELTAATPNLRGAVALDRENFDEARKQFEASLRVNPYFFPAKFNLADIPFRKKNYAQARAMYETILAQSPKNELVQYRIFLTYLLEKNMTEAEKARDAIKFPGETPAYYFAHACWEWTNGKTREGDSFIRSAQDIFGPARCRLFFEPLENLGWVKKKAEKKA